MKQIFSLFSLRAKQGYRFLKETGFGLIAVALFILTGIILSALQNILLVPAIWAVLLSSLVVFGIEIRRNDKFFLQSIFSSKIDLFRYKFFENTLIVLPIIIFQAIFNRWDIIGLIIGSIATVSILAFYLKMPDKGKTKLSLSIIPLSKFEVKFYFEKNIWPILFTMIILTLGGFHISLWILGMVFLCTIPLDIFTPMEPNEMLHYSSNFVIKKILTYVGFFLLLIAIPTLITILLSPDFYLVLIYGTFALVLSLVLSISKKYCNFYGVRSKVTSTTSTIILLFLILAPGGILITFAACIYYYFKAENHMKNTYANL